MIRTAGLSAIVLLCSLSALSAQAPAKVKPTSQQKAAAKKALQAQAKAEKQAQNLNTKTGQAQALKQAYTLMAGADKDYDGHRVKAMHAVSAAYRILDAEINKKGTAQQKAAAQQEDVLAAEAKLAAKQAPTIRENQAASDTQLKQASQLLTQVRTAMAQNNQPITLNQVDTALQELATALAIR